MYKYMMAHPELMMKQNEDGVARVYDGDHNYGNV